MARQLCCDTWDALRPQLKQQVLTEIAKAKVAEFIVKPQQRAVNNWDNFCPSCGVKLGLYAKTSPSPPTSPTRPLKKTVCPECHGKKIIAGEGTADPVNCMKCWGRGFVTSENKVSDVKEVVEEEVEQRIEQRKKPTEKSSGT